MICRISDLKDKEVVSVNNGGCLGPVSDIEMDTCSAKVVAIVIYGRPKLFGIMGREDDIVISWEHIQCIGEDTILVRYCRPRCRETKEKTVFERLFGC